MPWTVNNEEIDEAAVREQVRLMRPRYEQEVTGIDPLEAEMQLKEWARENVIEHILLRQTVAADPEPVPAELIQQGLENARTEPGGQAGCGSRNSDDEICKQVEAQHKLQRLLERVYEGAGQPKPKEVADFYKKNREQFRSAERIHAKHIVKHVNETQGEAAAQQSMKEAKAELDGGVPFEEVADRYSDCAGNGGDLGWFPRGEMVEEFDAVVFDMPIGALSPIFRTTFGFHIARVHERRAAGYLTLDEVKENIAGMLAESRREQALANYLDGLRAKAIVKRV